MTDVQAILDGIERREALEFRGSDFDSLGRYQGVHIADQFVLAVLAAAREELADAVAQQERHVGVGMYGAWCEGCGRTQHAPCPDAQQASRTLARLLALYGEAM